MADYWWLILLVAVLAVIGLVLLTRRGGGETLDRSTRTHEVSRDPEPDGPADQAVPPVLVIPQAAPLDVVPPSIPLIDEARVVIEDAPSAGAEDTADSDGPPDDLTVMKGVGPKLAALLADLGVTRYAQIARWTEADLARVDERLGAFKGRPTRDRWIEQARLLSGDDRGAFERTFGKIDPAA
ncbi:putative flap endonuclease-1-like 5' DNA nuclease [Sphingomonas jejuensis]|uniref:Flap endonuclease-1-like 5' DNA nuclease n=1 Tax=Sphingomonas jejuensis TaxID=904715 RepID=A0ABX0XPF9_9SPHN|nr:hypothetical protein [Sphingomonas jejuensis]NJC34550.1 putative flap endonuclease-1-like 5' DNA nuclease [Sphingomonas jejuensis]